MFATIRRYKGFPQDKMDEIVKRVADGFVPIITTSEGFIDFRFIESGGGIVTTVSVFDTMDASVASNIMAADWVKENLTEYNPSTPQISTGEVRIDK
ncbi:MAG: hypothetical protein ACI8ZB_005090 [Desulforhopalus sp.]|jgi:hypothetical protein